VWTLLLRSLRLLPWLTVPLQILRDKFKPVVGDTITDTAPSCPTSLALCFLVRSHHVCSCAWRSQLLHALLRLVPCSLMPCLLLRVALTACTLAYRSLFAHAMSALARGAHSMHSCVSFLVRSRHACSCAWRSQHAFLRLVVSCERIMSPCRLSCVVSSHHGGHGWW
jgi:hypothetical protein